MFDEALRFGEDADWFKRAEESDLAIERLPNISLLVRRHAGNMTRGKSMIELNGLVQTAVIDYDRFKELYFQNPQFGYRLLQMIVARMQHNRALTMSAAPP